MVDYRCNLHRRFGRILVLPNSNHGPSGLSEAHVRVPVSLDVLVEFFLPPPLV
jgi:hypothetical protein